MIETSVKIRVGQDKTAYEFADRTEAFDWVRKNFRPPMIVSVLFYEGGKLDRMDRYYYERNRQFNLENILS